MMVASLEVDVELTAPDKLVVRDVDSLGVSVVVGEGGETLAGIGTRSGLSGKVRGYLVEDRWGSIHS